MAALAESGHKKAPRGTVRSDCESACTGRFDLREQGVRKLLAQTVDRAPATAGPATGPSTSCLPRRASCASSMGTVAGSLVFTQIVDTVSVRTAGLVSISLAPPGKTESRPGGSVAIVAYPPVSVAAVAVLRLVHFPPTRVGATGRLRRMHENTRSGTLPYRLPVSGLVRPRPRCLRSGTRATWLRRPLARRPGADSRAR